MGDDCDEFLCLGTVFDPGTLEVSRESVYGGEWCPKLVGEAREESMMPLRGLPLTLDLRFEEGDPMPDPVAFGGAGDDRDGWDEQPEHDDGGDADRARRSQSERDESRRSRQQGESCGERPIQILGTGVAVHSHSVL